MRKYYIIILLAFAPVLKMASQDVEVLSLGTFHFAFYNQDVIKTELKDQIDVLDPQYQSEIKELVKSLSRFKPTHIAIEAEPGKQNRMDSLFRSYLNGEYELGRNEVDQIAFRLGKQMGLKKLYCVNAWGTDTPDVAELMSKKDTIKYQKFMDYFYENPDTSLFFNKERVFATEGIIKELQNANSDDNLRKDLGNYLISVFKYQTEDNEYFGVDFTTGWWFNRNLRILRNIQQIPAKEGDRIFVIFGAGHTNILNILFDASPEYKLVKTLEYLK